MWFDPTAFRILNLNIYIMCTLKWLFGDSVKRLKEEVDNIVGGKSIEELLEELPSEISYNSIQSAKLTIEKLTDTVWSVSYKVYIRPKRKRFGKTSVLFETGPSLKLVLFKMTKQLKKNNTKK